MEIPRMCEKVWEFNDNMRVKVGISSQLLLGAGVPLLGDSFPSGKKCTLGPVVSELCSHGL